MDLSYTPATELAARIRRGDLSPVDVVEHFLDRIERRNDEFNAYVTVCDELARTRAREAERASEPGRTSVRSTASRSPSRTSRTSRGCRRPSARSSSPTSSPRRTP